jgi:hypothetical protein
LCTVNDIVVISLVWIIKHGTGAPTSHGLWPKRDDHQHFHDTHRMDEGVVADTKGERAHRIANECSC